MKIVIGSKIKRNVKIKSLINTKCTKSSIFVYQSFTIYINTCIFGANSQVGKRET